MNIKLLYIGAGLAALLSCQRLPEGPQDIPDSPYRPKTELGKMLDEAASMGKIYGDTSFVVASGVEETDVHFQTSTGKVEHAFFLKIDLTTPGLKMKVGMPFDIDSYVIGSRQTPSDMIEYVDKPGQRVVAVVNADFWDTSNGKIRGPIHRDGRVLKNTFVYSPNLTDQAISFFGMDFDGRPVIRDTVTYREMASDLRDVTGSGVIVLNDGQVPGDFSGYSTNRHPRNVVGYSEDGNTLYFMIVDGRQPLWSDGMLYWEMGELMKSLGCSWASNLDGGGSAQLVIRNPKVPSLYQLRNRASDGAQRAVVNTWMVLLNEDGIPETLSVRSCNPSSGVGGDRISIIGSGFSRDKAKNEVAINGKKATVEVANDTRLVVVIPDNPAGAYPVMVTVDGQTVMGPPFTYNAKPQLAVFSVNPTSGRPGDRITVKGQCFTDDVTVSLNGVAAEIISVTPDQLVFLAPENPTGVYPVVVTADGKTVEGPQFMYVAEQHTYTVKTISGSAGRAADVNTLIDGPSDKAKFRQPRGVAFLPDGRLLIFDNGNNALRFLDLATWEVTSSSEAAKSLLNAAWRGSVFGEWVYIASKGNNKIIRYQWSTDRAEEVNANFTGTSPMDVCFDKNGNGYVLVRDGSKAIFKAAGDDFTQLTTFTTFEDGPLAMEFAPDGNLVVTTNGCQVISVAPDGTQSVIAGIRMGKADDNGVPGQPLTAKFGSNLFSVTVDGTGRIYLADDSFKVIKLITPGSAGYADAVVSTIAGQSGVSGKADGEGTEATFGSPGEIRIDAAGRRLIVTEYNHFLIREILIN